MIRHFLTLSTFGVFLLVANAVAAQEADSQRFDFPAIVLKKSEPTRVSGTYQLPAGSIVFLFLHDRFGDGGYLQGSRVSLLKDKWVHSNVRASDSNITEISAVLVDNAGSATVKGLIESNRFGKIPSEEIEKLGGFKELGRAEVQVK
jgi:hypothetical protein